MYIDLIQYIVSPVKNQDKGLIIIFDLMQEQWFKKKKNCKTKSRTREME